MNEKITRAIEYLKLDRPIRFWLVVIVAYIGIIAIHNHYFYVSDEYDSKRDLKKIATMINTTAEICVSNESVDLLSKELACRSLKI